MSAESKKIIIVEDEPSLVFTLEDTLENEGYHTFVAEKGDDAVDIVKNEDLDLMILDLMLPGMSGYDVCKKVRAMNYTFPIIMLTARDQEIDKVTGLNIGADDYITKPFGVKELLARIQARLRRSNQYAKAKPINELELGDIHIDLKNARADHPERGDIELTTREVELIRYLAAHANEPVSRDALLENVWRYEFSTNTRTVDVHISKLRSKVEMHPDNPKYLVTLHGVGYMLKMS
ncbi:two-component system, OmpR family, response regulator VicR [Fodinibius roseus]|uniref:Two-component system, OmpR family, response regulator VicR n=1 Tax=Fodinibius roseus TaxID=1194090 RepID=A0A1M5H706_9BACT|nr:response regulator transcription factor [Fodinibius roseus]SHG11686.1 two-component system, OmpR family, response regulator VicR [Fodinibius roseus]